MTKLTGNQRAERMQAPYTITRAVVTEFGTTVQQLIGVYYEQKFDGEEWKVVRTELDLGQHSNVALASKAGSEYREDPETYYEKHQREQAEQMKAAVLANPDNA